MFNVYIQMIKDFLKYDEVDKETRVYCVTRWTERFEEYAMQYQKRERDKSNYRTQNAIRKVFEEKNESV